MRLFSWNIFGQPRVLKICAFEILFFGCNSCKTDYTEQYKGRIESQQRY
jgi:hypothetical protein